MNLQEYICRLQSYIASCPPDLGDEESILGILYEAHSESNAMYDDEIKADFHTLYEAMNGIPLREMDQIVYPVCILCRSHQKSGLLYTKEKGVYVGPPKTGRPRAVCLAPETIDVLKKWKTEQLRTKIRHADIWQDTGFIFTKDDGTAMHPDSITDWLNKFSDTNELPHINPHAFRHTVASILIANGIDSVTTANELGHADANTTNAIYAHQIARARAEASGVRAGVFSVLREA